MSIKISELGNLNVFTDTTLILAVNTASPTLTTVKSSGLTLKNYILAGNTQIDIDNLKANAVAQQSAIWQGNLGMKGYVDSKTVGYATLVYVNGQITAANTGVTSANVAMKGYVDSKVLQANLGMKGYVDTQSTTFAGNAAAQQRDIANIWAVLSGVAQYGNANVAVYLPVYSGNVGGNVSRSTQPFITQVGILSSVNVSGNAWVRTPTAGDSSNQIATTAFVQNVAWNSQGRKTISSNPPQGGSDGDIWYQV